MKKSCFFRKTGVWGASGAIFRLIGPQIPLFLVFDCTKRPRLNPTTPEPQYILSPYSITIKKTVTLETQNTGES